MTVTDFLTCGSCQTEFPLTNIVIFMEHKKSDCNFSPKTDYQLTNYSCFTCPKQFSAAVSLLQHAQYQHRQKIFKDATNKETVGAPTAITSQASPHTTDTCGSEKSGLLFKSDNGEMQENLPDHTLNSCDAFDTNEPLSKCCSAIVPKKRKRHFETKHRTSFFKNSRTRRQAVSLPSNIYINVDQSSLNSSEGENQPVADHGLSHSTVLEPGKMVNIPFTGSDGVGSCFGISYTDSSRGNGTYGILSSSSNSLTPAVKNPIQSPPNHQPTSSALSMKKKYPTSKPFKCDHCEDSFNQRIHLKKHQSKHTGVKPYKCSECDYATVERSHLKVHIRIHTGEKPFKCDHCEYSTAQNSTLKIHLKRHHGGSVSLECTHCGKHFPERTQLMWHTQEHGVSEQSSAERQMIKYQTPTTTEYLVPAEYQPPMADGSNHSS